MAEQARVTELDTLEFFRQRLLVFHSKAQRVLDDTRDEVKRMNHWLQNEQWRHWEMQIKKRAKLLEMAEAELMTARFSEFVETPSVQQANVRKARRSLEEAEEKLRMVKKWSREFERLAEPHTKRMDSVRGWLDTEVPKASNYLYNAQRLLEDYARTALPAPNPTLPTAPPEEAPPS
jgi:hypothetical protein